MTIKEKLYSLHKLGIIGNTELFELSQNTLEAMEFLREYPYGEE